MGQQFNDWLKKGRNFRNEDNVEFYEDTHDENGEYVAAAATQEMPQYSTISNKEKSIYGSPSPLPDNKQYVAPRFYQNVVVYEPRTPEDVQMLIDYLRRREPAIINLDGVNDTFTAQRILDYLSGAIYALNGSVHRIAGNIFLLSPEGVEITVPYEL